ncbi:hypothetical protein [Caldimonas tepidiphila]|uniref:hypothetical protein n=1 Tax=Caldimonas tepidiphila TaxID=2315841 RepID=UPI000E5B0EAA|nr:hypothetical protein [Caldimonas tepidiphila]
MAEPGRPTLLDFAIAASAAVLPVLLLVLLAVAAWAPADPSLAPGATPDRYVNVRQLAALRTFEPAIVRRREVSAGLPDAQALLARLPQCRDEWSARPGLRDRLRALVGGNAAPHVSTAQRVAAQLAALDRALAAFSRGGNRRVSEPVGLDAGRWMRAAAAALEAPVESSQYPGRGFALRCADLAAAVHALSRAEGRMLQTLAWRGSVVPQVLARWRPGQFMEVSPVQVARHNPWAGLPGCVYLSASGQQPTHFVGGPDSGGRRLCAEAAVAGLAAGAGPPAALDGEPGPELAPDDPRWQVPPSLGTLLRPLDALRRPTGALYRAYTADAAEAGGAPQEYRYGPNRLELDGTPIDVGFSIDLTIDPALQALAQKTAACYTGRHDVCRALGLRRREDGASALGHRLLEGAMVRMAAVAVVDVASGRIDALAGALSPCTRQEFDGPGRAAGCDARLPYPVRYRPDALLNPAVFHDAMPASVIKPVMASAFLSDPEVGARWLDAERRAQQQQAGLPQLGPLGAELMRSDSARFLDRLFCAERGYADCERPARVQRAAAALGWNAGCTDALAGCGTRDLLFGRAPGADAEGGRVQPLANFLPYGRLLVEPVEGRAGAPFRAMPGDLADAATLAQCAAGADGRRGSDDDWERCRGASVVDAVSQGWGQGHARASALGVAGMLAGIAAAANGEDAVRRPHLVRGLRGVGRRDAGLAPAALRWELVPPEPLGVPAEAAQRILGALSRTHRGGTAQPACEQVFDARACRGIDWLAGKTGTPTFPNDGRTLDELARLCGGGRGAARAGLACSPLRPYKWYVAAYRPPGGGPRWTKVIAVLAERNWLREGGRVHAAGDLGPNPAAEIAMQIAARHVGVLPGRTE